MNEESTRDVRKLPLISVIMPVYNGEKYVAEAIESVLAQTYPHWELIVVDDGSTDATPARLQHFTDPRITIIRQANKGEGGARNTGLDIAQGAYVGFLDADDLYLPNALADLSAYLNAHREMDVVFSDGYFCDAQKTPLMRLSEHRAARVEGVILEPLMVTPTVVAQPLCMMLRSAALEAHEIRFDETLQYGVDWDFWIQVARWSKFGGITTITGLYRVHDNNMTSNATVRKRKDDLVVGRLKLMNEEWFGALSQATRTKFFYLLLVDLLEGQKERQLAVLQTPQFSQLPAPSRAEIWRLVASDYIEDRSALGFSRYCLEQSVTAWPADRKSQLLLRLLTFSPTICRIVLDAWRVIQRTRTCLRLFWQPAPKPVPTLLRPATE